MNREHSELVAFLFNEKLGKNQNDKENLVRNILVDLAKGLKNNYSCNLHAAEEYDAIISIRPIRINTEIGLKHSLNKPIIGYEIYYCRGELYELLMSAYENNIIWDYDLKNEYILCLVREDCNGFTALKERISEALNLFITYSDTIKNEQNIMTIFKLLEEIRKTGYINDDFKTEYKEDKRLDFVRRIQKVLTKELNLKTKDITPKPFRAFCEKLFASEIPETIKKSLDTAWNRARGIIP